MFTTDLSEDFVRIERQKAKALRRTRWWKQKIAQGRCYYCGKSFPPGELTMDHIVPISRGGRSVKNNCVPACKDCNNRKKYHLGFEFEATMKPDKRE